MYIQDPVYIQYIQDVCIHSIGALKSWSMSTDLCFIGWGNSSKGLRLCGHHSCQHKHLWREQAIGMLWGWMLVSVCLRLALCVCACICVCGRYLIVSAQQLSDMNQDNMFLSTDATWLHLAMLCFSMQRAYESNKSPPRTGFLQIIKHLNLPNFNSLGAKLSSHTVMTPLVCVIHFWAKMK